MTTTASGPRSTPAEAAACSSGTSMHPLEIFPIFRRIPRSTARDLVFTFVWNQMFAVVFTLLNVMFDPRETFFGAFWPTSVFANCIGFIIHLEFMVGDRLWPWIHTRGPIVRGVYFTVPAVIGVFAGYWLGTWILDFDAMRSWIFSPRGGLLIGTLSFIISGVLLMIFLPRERAARLAAEVEHEKAQVAAAEKQATLAKLRLLEAQVEPHFLYNTLANVVSLIDAEPATARAMVERLIALLRGSAAIAGTDGVTLAVQVEHLRAYLDLIALRMGGRLAYRIDVPAPLGGVTLPSLLLQPLVENAIRHGLEPKVGGGEVVVSAHREGGVLALTVADDGVGFAATKVASADGDGLGLANLRERLTAIYGTTASVVVEDNEPSGARITLRLPVAAST